MKKTHPKHQPNQNPKNRKKEEEETVKEVEDVSDDLSIEEVSLAPPELEADEEDNETSEEEDDEYSQISRNEPVFWDGNIPKPKTIVAIESSKTDKDAQVQQCEEIIALLNNDTAATLEALNQATLILPFLLERVCKIVYSLGSGNGITGLITNTLGDDVLALHCEIVPLAAIPSVFHLPEEALYPKLMNVPSMAQIQVQRKKKNALEYWFKHKEIKKASYLPSLIPVPAFLVYDGFDKDLDPIVILERWLNLRETLKGVYRDFDALLSCYTRAQTVIPTKPYPQGALKSRYFMNLVPSLTQLWKRKRLKQLSPSTLTQINKRRPLQLSRTHSRRQ